MLDVSNTTNLLQKRFESNYLPAVNLF